jgi:hypothetical protein
VIPLRELPPETEELLRTLLNEGRGRSPDTCGTTAPLGILYPRDFARANRAFELARLECVARAERDAKLTISFRCLHADGAAHSAVEHVFHGPVVQLDALERDPLSIPFSFEPQDAASKELEGRVQLACTPLDSELVRITFQVANETPFAARSSGDESGDEPGECARALRRALLATHLVVRIERGRFISPTEERGQYGRAAQACRSVNTWPVLAHRRDDIVIGAASVLPDHPEIANEPRERAERAAGSDANARRPDGPLTEAERAAIRGEDAELETRIERALAYRAGPTVGARRGGTSSVLDAAPSAQGGDARGGDGPRTR